MTYVARKRCSDNIPRTIAVLLLAALLPLAPTAAQGPASAATTLDAVVVTANKRVENVQEVPKSILVVTPEALSRSGVTTIRELGNIIPSINPSASERRAVPPIRGIASFAGSIGVQSQTGIIIDDVPQAKFSSLFKELTDIERIEVLAGPQSTLSGRNASGGLINIVTREPSDTFSAEMSLEHTSDRQQRMTAFMTGPLSQTLGFSVSAFSNEWEGNVRSLTESKGNRPLHLNGWDTQGVRGKLRWQPNERLDSTLTLYTMESEYTSADDTVYFFASPTAYNSFDSGLRRPLRQFFPELDVKRYNVWTGSPYHSSFKSRDRGGSFKLEYELQNAATLTSITSIAKADIPRQEMLLNLPIAGTIIPATAESHAFTTYETEHRVQELRLTSPGEQAFDYLLGLSYTDTDSRRPYHRFLGVPGIDANVDSTFAMKSTAVFTRGTWNVGERDALTAGLRYQYDDMDYSVTIFPPLRGATVPISYTAGGESYDFLSAEASWRHVLTEDVNAYLTLARAQSGEVYDLEDFAGANEEGELRPLNSQKVRNIELGLKGQWWQKRLTVNVNAFLARYDNYHFETFRQASDPNTPPRVKLYAIGEVETRGIEFETRLRATERWNFNLAGAWIDATIKDYPNAPCYTRQSAALGCENAVQANIAGNRMPYTPKFKLTTAARYFLPLDRLPYDVEFGAFWRWQTKSWFDHLGNPNRYQGSYGILNLSAALLDRDGRYSLSVFVNNVLDKPFYLSTDDGARWTEPVYYGSFSRDSFRYAGVNLRVNF